MLGGYTNGKIWWLRDSVFSNCENQLSHNLFNFPILNLNFVENTLTVNWNLQNQFLSTSKCLLLEARKEKTMNKKLLKT